MKQAILFIGIIFTMLSNNIAQYHPMLGDTTEWCIAWNYVGVRSGSGHMMEQPKFIAMADTLIDSVSYKKVFNSSSLLSYYGGIREDSLNQKVYFIKSGDTLENLLYDFSLNTGDTMVIDLRNNSYGNLNDGNYIVDTTYMINIRGGLRKYLRLHNPLNTSTGPFGYPLKMEWIESVGDIHNTIYTYAEDGFGWGFLLSSCNLQHESSILKNTINGTKNYVDICAATNSYYVLLDTCTVGYAGSIQDKNKLHEITTFPNPSNGNNLEIHINDNLINGNYTLIITDETGRKVFRNNICINGGEPIKITNLELAQGTYILTIHDKRNIFAKSKLIVLR